MDKTKYILCSIMLGFSGIRIEHIKTFSYRNRSAAEILNTTYTVVTFGEGQCLGPFRVGLIRGRI